MAKAKKTQEMAPIEPEVTDIITSEETNTVDTSKEAVIEETAAADTPEEAPVVEEVTTPVEEEKEVTLVAPIVQPAIVELSNKELPVPDRILAYLKNRPATGFIKLNDFLKSLFPLPAVAAPPLWTVQHENKILKVILDKMQTDGLIVINNNQHKKLATHYYDGDDPVTRYWNIGNTIIEAKAV